MSAMIYKLVEKTSKNFNKFLHKELLPDVCKGDKFVDGLPAVKKKK
ncbi:MAG: hypothetical protein LBF82_02065 [Lactobacillales bacterium]|jgi:hypothetical protein|nr:hypothetical protein [Lactobacillales bacterium]